MGKTTKQENYRVVIEPRRLGDFGFASVGDWMVSSDEAELQRLYKERCEEIVRDVRRHVENVGSASVESDTVATCEHCGYRWGEESPDYNGGCCDKDQEAQDAREASA